MKIIIKLAILIPLIFTACTSAPKDTTAHNTCDVSMIDTADKPIVDLTETLNDKDFQQQVKEYFSAEQPPDSVLYQQSGCYFSACGATVYNVNTNTFEKALQCFIFTQDLEEIGTLHFNMDGSKLISSYSINDVNAGTRSAVLKKLSEKPDENYVILTDGFNNVMLLNKENETVRLSAGSEDFTIVGDCFGSLAEDFGIAYNEIISENNLVWIEF